MFLTVVYLHATPVRQGGALFCEQFCSKMEIVVNDEPIGDEQVERERSQAKRGLGDLAEDFFTSLGVTDERYKAAKVVLHLDPTCGCADRKKWLNEMGAKLGVDGVVMKMAAWLDTRKE